MIHLTPCLGFPGGSEVKASACNEGDLGSIPGSGRSPGEGNGNPLQYSCLENPMDSPRDRKESDTTERLHFHFLYHYIDIFLYHCIHTQFRIQQGSIACLYPTRDATLSRFIPNSGPKVCTPLINNDMCICTFHLAFFSSHETQVFTC